MKKVIIILTVIGLLGACSNQGNNNDSSKTTENESTYALTLDEFFQSPQEYVDQEITIEGMVTHVCKHGGQKLFIATNENPENLRINTSENISEFNIELEGSMVEFTGVLKKMDEEFIEEAIAEENEHHPEEEGHTTAEKENRNMEYYLVANSFEPRK